MLVDADILFVPGCETASRLGLVSPGRALESPSRLWCCPSCCRGVGGIAPGLMVCPRDCQGAGSVAHDAHAQRRMVLPPRLCRALDALFFCFDGFGLGLWLSLIKIVLGLIGLEFSLSVVIC